jgi:hypothetical protein
MTNLFYKTPEQNMQKPLEVYEWLCGFHENEEKKHLLLEKNIKEEKN